MNHQKAKELEASTEMEPIHGTVDVDIPADVLWKAFTNASQWPRWNKCMFWAHNKDLVLGKQLVWCFNPMKWYYFYKMPAFAEIIEVEVNRKVTWEVVKALPGFYAHHTYSIEDLGDDRCRFGSWEKAYGKLFHLTKAFWIAHFIFVKDESLAGAKALEEQYRRDGALDPAKLRRKPRVLLLALLTVLLAIAGGATWLYINFLRVSSQELAPGIHAVFGGCNSLVIEDGGQTLVIDPKFPPVDGWMESWLSKNTRAPVTQIVNTHYHFDHTQGNTLYPGAKISAYTGAAELMKASDGDFWQKHPGGLPQAESAVGDEPRTLKVGSVEVVVRHPGVTHTHSDLWAYIHKGDVEIVVTGDMVFNGYYPFLDTSSGGSSLTGIITAVRDLAARYPNAIFLPGHGPLARASDLIRYASYLEALEKKVREAHEAHLTEDQAVKSIDLSSWGLSIIPIFHYGTIFSTASTNVRAAYRLQATQ